MKMSANKKSHPYMMAQIPFNIQNTVKLNQPMVDLMDDDSNLKVNLKNFKKLNIHKFSFKKKTTLLEIGSGRGYLLKELYQKGEGKYFALEPILSEYKIAVKKIKELKKLDNKTIKERILNKTLEKTSLKNNFFDLIISYHVFEHLENPIVIFQKAQKWLKKKGKLVITCPNVEGAIPKKDITKWRCNIPSHRWLPGKDRLIDLYERNNFKIEKFFTYGGFPQPRNYWQEMLNFYYYLTNQGDIMSISGIKI